MAIITQLPRGRPVIAVNEPLKAYLQVSFFYFIPSPEGLNETPCY